MFEIKYSDLAGRIGVLHTNHGKIETPSFVPVIHPVKQTIPAKKINAIIDRTDNGDIIDWLGLIQEKNDLKTFFEY